MNLTDEEKIVYLANVISVSRSDGSVSPSENRAIDDIQKSIGAQKSVLKKAELLAQKESFVPNIVGSFSSRISNLEDMLYVSLSDGSIDGSEKTVILDFAKKTAISNEQLQLILSEVRCRISATVDNKACVNCSAKVSRDAKFCPECGCSLEMNDKASSVAVEYEIPNDGISIEFAESTASGFVNAVRKAKNAPVASECAKGKKTWYMASWPKSQVEDAVKLVEDLKGMRNRKVWVDGQESRWDDVFGFAWCSGQRNIAYRPFEYCFGVDDKQLNIWGCKNARMDWTKWSEWFSYGSYRPGGLLKSGHVFVFDKKRIRHELETNLYRVRFCPHLNLRLIEAVFAHFPDEIDVTSNGDWAYKRDYEQSPGSIKVKLKSIENGYTYTDEFYSSGVEPRNPSIGLAILKHAFKEAGADSSGLNGVLKYRGE